MVVVLQALILAGNSQAAPHRKLQRTTRVQMSLVVGQALVEEETSAHPTLTSRMAPVTSHLQALVVRRTSVVTGQRSDHLQ